MEKVKEFNSRYSKFDNLTQHFNFIRVNDSVGNGRLVSYIWITLFILFVVIWNIKRRENIKTFYYLWFKDVNYNFALNQIYLLVACFVLPILTTAIALFFLIKQVVNVILKIKYGNTYGGILASPDSVWAIEDVSRSVLNILLILKVPASKTENITDQLRHIISQKIFQNWENFPKLTSTRHKFLGYTFLLKNQLIVNDCFTTLHIKRDIKLDQTGLQQIMSDYSNQPLPKKHLAMWEIIGSSVPIQWHSMEESANYYPVILRFSHIVGDGLSLLNLILKTFADNNDNSVSFEKLYINNSSQGKVFRQDIFSKSKQVAKTILSFLYILLMSPSLVVRQHFLRKDDVNYLHGPELSGEKNLVYTVEDKKELITSVKDIKNSIPNCTFSDVLCAAISGSLYNHFKRNSPSIPKCVSAVVPVLLSPPNMAEVPMLQNQFSVGILNIPVGISTSSMLKRLQETIRYTRELRVSPEFKIYYWIVKYICGLIPEQILKMSLKTDQLTMTISSVPGIPKVLIMDDCEIEDILFFTNHRGKTGVGLGIFTYDDRFQITLSVDKSLTDSTEEAQLIVDDILQCLKSLQEELHNQNVSRKM